MLRCFARAASTASLTPHPTVSARSSTWSWWRPCHWPSLAARKDRKGCPVGGGRMSDFRRDMWRWPRSGGPRGSRRRPGLMIRRRGVKDLSATCRTPSPPGCHNFGRDLKPSSAKPIRERSVGSGIRAASTGKREEEEEGGTRKWALNLAPRRGGIQFVACRRGKSRGVGRPRAAQPRARPGASCAGRPAATLVSRPEVGPDGPGAAAWRCLRVLPVYGHSLRQRERRRAPFIARRCCWGCFAASCCIMRMPYWPAGPAAAGPPSRRPRMTGPAVP